MAGVCRDPLNNDLFERLVDRQVADARRSIFKTNIDLTVFAAMVGFSRSRLVELKERTNEIPERVFVNQNIDGLVYLVAVLHEKSGDMLRERNESAAWQIFEQYANGGMEVIREVFAENPNDFDGVSSLLSFIKEEAILLGESST